MGMYASLRLVSQQLAGNESEPAPACPPQMILCSYVSCLVFNLGAALSAASDTPTQPCTAIAERWKRACRFAQQNRIKAVADLSCAPDLNTLNVSNNEISTLSGLSKSKLETLLCSNNQLSSVDSIAHLIDVPTLQTLDLQNNQLDDPRILDILKKLPCLKCLYLKGNPVVSKISNYRWVTSLHSSLSVTFDPISLWDEAAYAPCKCSQCHPAS